MIAQETIKYVAREIPQVTKLPKDSQLFYAGRYAQLCNDYCKLILADIDYDKLQELQEDMMSNLASDINQEIIIKGICRD